jgi:hypothetical protein
MNGFIGTSVTNSRNHSQLYRHHYSTHFQSTVEHALVFSVSTSRLLATDLSTEIITSNHYEVFLLFRLQSLWNLGTKTSSGLTPPAHDWLVTAPELILSLPPLFWESLYIAAARTTQKTQFYFKNHCVIYKMSTENSVPTVARRGRQRNTASSIVACWYVFTELLPGNALIKSVTIL